MFGFLNSIRYKVKLSEMGLNGIILSSNTNGWSKQSYVQGFEYEYIALKDVNMFEHMEILESVN